MFRRAEVAEAESLLPTSEESGRTLVSAQQARRPCQADWGRQLPKKRHHPIVELSGTMEQGVLDEEVALEEDVQLRHTSDGQSAGQ